jgi:hypothetical protein
MNWSILKVCVDPCRSSNTFGIVKRQFRILTLCPKYSLIMQAKFQSAIIALHNFITINTQQQYLQHDGPERADHDDGEGEIYTATVSAVE